MAGRVAVRRPWRTTRRRAECPLRAGAGCRRTRLRPRVAARAVRRGDSRAPPIRSSCRRPGSSSSPIGSASRATSARSFARPKRPAPTPSSSLPGRSTRPTRRSCGRRRERCSTSRLLPRRSADVAAAGLRLIGSSSHRGMPHTSADWSGRIAIVVGNEASGLDAEVPIDEWVRIEHRGRAESLNVAMATTVLCFEALRQRTARQRPLPAGSEPAGGPGRRPPGLAAGVVGPRRRRWFRSSSPWFVPRSRTGRRSATPPTSRCVRRTFSPPTIRCSARGPRDPPSSASR